MRAAQPHERQHAPSARARAAGCPDPDHCARVCAAGCSCTGDRAERGSVKASSLMAAFVFDVAALPELAQQRILLWLGAEAMFGPCVFDHPRQNQLDCWKRLEYYFLDDFASVCCLCHGTVAFPVAPRPAVYTPRDVAGLCRPNEHGDQVLGVEDVFPFLVGQEVVEEFEGSLRAREGKALRQRAANGTSGSAAPSAPYPRRSADPWWYRLV